MRLCWLRILVGTAVIVQMGWTAASAQSTRSDRSSTDPLAAGKRLYVARCQTCHGSNGEGGDARLEKVLGARPPALRSESVQQKSDEQIATAVRSGAGRMKPLEGLTRAEIRQIVGYLRTLPSAPVQ
jgi:mono/diheme cytochrome c family protein